MSTTRALEGGCLCGAVRYSAGGKISHACICHCRSCRLAAGAPYVGWVTLEAAGFSVTQGEITEFRSSRKATRGFCNRCGSAITYRNHDHPDWLDVTTATLDDAASVAPEFHLWVSHKLPWVTLDDSLPQYAEWRTGKA